MTTLEPWMGFVGFVALSFFLSKALRVLRRMRKRLAIRMALRKAEMTGSLKITKVKLGTHKRYGTGGVVQGTTTHHTYRDPVLEIRVANKGKAGCQEIAIGFRRVKGNEPLENGVVRFADLEGRQVSNRNLRTDQPGRTRLTHLYWREAGKPHNVALDADVTFRPGGKLRLLAVMAVSLMITLAVMTRYGA